MTIPIVLGVLLLAGAALYALRGVRSARRARRLTAGDPRAVTGATGAGATEAAEKSRRAAEVVALGFVPEAELDTVHPVRSRSRRCARPRRPVPVLRGSWTG
ncbi:hypothetical protein ACWD0G_23875 [Streptomyces goshikiensis]